MVIGDVRFIDLITHRYPLQQALGRKINPKNYSISEWRQLVEEEGVFVRDLLSRPTW